MEFLKHKLFRVLKDMQQILLRLRFIMLIWGSLQDRNPVGIKINFRNIILPHFINIKFSNFDPEIILPYIVPWATFRLKFNHFLVILMINDFERGIFCKSFRIFLLVQEKQSLRMPQIMALIIDGLKWNEAFSSTKTPDDFEASVIQINIGILHFIHPNFSISIS